MAIDNEQGVIIAPISAKDPYTALGVAATADGYEVGYICTHNKVNRYSYCKPIEEDTPAEVSFTNQKYIDSLVPVKYTSGAAAPTNFTYGYNKPTSWRRLTDFSGYRHNEYPCRGSIDDIPDTVDFEVSNIWFPFYCDQSSRALLSMLLSGDPLANKPWKVAIILVSNWGGGIHAFKLSSQLFTSNRVGFYLFNKALYFKFRDAGIQTFNAKAFVVGIPQGHSMYNGHDGIEELSNGIQFTCYPASPVCVPYKSSFVIRRPKRRCWMKFIVTDMGDGYDLYIPEDTVINAYLKYNDEIVFQYQSYEWGRDGIIEEYADRLNEGTNYVQGQMLIPDVQLSSSIWTRAQISGNYDRSVYDEGLHTTELYWDRKVAGDEFEMGVAFTYSM